METWDISKQYFKIFKYGKDYHLAFGKNFNMLSDHIITVGAGVDGCVYIYTRGIRYTVRLDRCIYPHSFFGCLKARFPEL